MIIFPRVWPTLGWSALVYFFGGGWTLGNIETSDAICRSLANPAGCVPPAYRLS